MKTLLVLSILFFSNFLHAEYPIGNLLLKSKISDYLSINNIQDFRVDDFGYGFDKEYSLLIIMNPRQVFSLSYDVISISYSNETDQIEYVAAFITKFSSLEECIDYRNKQILYSDFDSNYKMDKAVTTHDDGDTQDQIIYYINNNLEIKFNCDKNRQTINYRIDYLTDSFNLWVVELEGSKTKYE